jgi:serine O-acetyltransferase
MEIQMVIRLFRVSSWLHKRGVPILPKLIYAFNRIVFSVVIPPTVTIGDRVTLAYQGLATVIHARAKIGSDVYIGPQTIIGGRGGEYNVPVIGDRVFIGAGARILGPVTIGDGATVAAGATVIHNVLVGQVVAGVPAKPIKSTSKEMTQE